jgi:hypothetical protein
MDKLIAGILVAIGFLATAMIVGVMLSLMMAVPTWLVYNWVAPQLWAGAPHLGLMQVAALLYLVRLVFATGAKPQQD